MIYSIQCIYSSDAHKYYNNHTVDAIDVNIVDEFKGNNTFLIKIRNH